MAREYTKKILNMNDEGLFDKDLLILDLLNRMSEADVQKFYYTAGLDGDPIAVKFCKLHGKVKQKYLGKR